VESQPEDPSPVVSHNTPVQLPGLDAEQSKQLLQFLTTLQSTKQSPQESYGSLGHSSHQEGYSAHMAGINPTLLQYIASATTVCCTCKLEGRMWIIDSGASDHMVSDNTLLCNISYLKHPILITLQDGSKVKVTQFGDLKLGKNLILHHVLFVPYFQFNLLSVKRLSEQLKCRVIFSEDSCVLQGPSLKRPLEIGKSIQGLYIVDGTTSKKLELDEISAAKCSYSFCRDKKQLSEQYSFTCHKDHSLANLWHMRMGHISFRKLSYMSVLKSSDCTPHTPQLCFHRSTPHRDSPKHLPSSG